jgi:rubrerythrin
MEFEYNAEEILEMAIQIERNGAKYYRLAAEGADDESSRNLLNDLAAMEDEHEKTFAFMKKNLSEKEKESTAFDPDNQASAYLRAMVEGIVFDVKTGPEKILARQKSLEDILKQAIEFEKDSIVFYLGMKDAVPQRLGGEKVDDIIKEEMRHIGILSRHLSSLKS